MTLSLIDVFAARRRLASATDGLVQTTPLIRARDLAGAASASGPWWLKLETLHPSRSFKLRGAFNVLLARRERGEAADPVVTASAGNHGSALALAAEALGIPITVVTPASAPAAKLTAIRRTGATLQSDAPDYDSAERAALDLARSRGWRYISPYNDPDVIAGAGTIGLEILEAVPAIETIVVRVGGGGLLSGIALAVKGIDPRIEVVGVEAAASPVFTTSLAAGRITAIQVAPTLADGLAGNLEEGSSTFDIITRLVDRVVAAAMRALVYYEKLLAEGAAATALAGVLTGKVPAGSRQIAIVLSGANVDLATLRAVLGQ
jgi:threonine dehydratase